MTTKGFGTTNGWHDVPGTELKKALPIASCSTLGGRRSRSAGSANRLCRVLDTGCSEAFNFGLFLVSCRDAEVHLNCGVGILARADVRDTRSSVLS